MKKLIALFLALTLCAALTGCGGISEGSKNYTKHTGLVAIDGHDNLYYDPMTKVVYIIFNEMTGSGNRGYGYMSPYYADNGLPYLYDPSTRALIKITDKT